VAKVLKIERQARDGATHIALSGDITEEARFAEAGDLAGRVVVDLEGIQRINSCGVREWVQFVRRAPPDSDIRYTRCPPVIVAQANMIANFLGPGHVASFLAPYYCSKCDQATTVLLDVDRDFPEKRPVAPVKKCERCGETLVFDDFEDSYFAFLNR
jgi:hypothetical protein